MLLAYAVIAAVALLSSTTITPVLAQPSYTQLTKATATRTNAESTYFKDFEYNWDFTLTHWINHEKRR